MDIYTEGAEGIKDKIYTEGADKGTQIALRKLTSLFIIHVEGGLLTSSPSNGRPTSRIRNPDCKSKVKSMLRSRISQELD